jgi:predicted secreted protein
MTLVAGIAIYFVLWWLVLFTVLPWGSSSAHELGEEAQAGHAASAPVNPRLVAKFVATTLIAAVLFAVGWWVSEAGWVTIDSVPFLPDFRDG